MWVCIFPEDKTHQKNLKNEVVIFFRYRYKQVICHFRTTANRPTNRQETDIKNVTLRP
jgi:hypothetical protein